MEIALTIERNLALQARVGSLAPVPSFLRLSYPGLRGALVLRV